MNVNVSKDVIHEYQYGIDETQSNIPSIIWTFWDKDELPKMIQTCIATWRKYNPSYVINIVNPKNIKNFLPNFDIFSLKHIDNRPAHLSDYVRLNLLKVYGGIWMDASIICNTSLNWLHSIQIQSKKDFIGYKLAKTEVKSINVPTIESWFLACVPSCQFISDWCDEFMITQRYENFNDYLDDIRRQNINFQKITYLPYLTSYMSAQKILQKNKYSMFLMEAEEGPLKYIFDGSTNNILWFSNKAINNLFSGKYRNYPIIKITNGERKAIEQQKRDLSEIV